MSLQPQKKNLLCYLRFLGKTMRQVKRNFGEGAHSEVYKVKRKTDGVLYALKK